ncbi:MAG: O-antigen ligase family protein [Candidatus Shapirobacteria bacterium]|nr:O-antigen ligase family protein [Candidatus Shapirobacteria bacterium]
MFKNINIFRAIVAILILFIPLYPKFPLNFVSGTYVAIRLDDIVVLLCVLVWLIYQITNKLPFLKIKITRLFIAYLLAITTSMITAILIYQTEPLNILLLNLFRRFEYMSLFFITVDSIKTKKDFTFPYIFLILSTTLVSLYGYGQKYFNFPVISTMNSEFAKGQLLQMDVWTRINSTFAGHYDLATFMSVVLVIIGGVTLLSKKWWIKITGLIIWLAVFPILTLTASRISTFAFWAGMCLTLILIKKYLWIIPVSLLMIFSIFNSKDLNQRLLATVDIVQKRFTVTPTPAVLKIEPTIPPQKPPVVAIKPITKPVIPTPTIFRHEPTEEFIPIDSDIGVARSGEIRFNVEWPRAITALTKNPITGTGLGSITLATDNDYLRLLGESGVLGFITFMGINFYFIIRTIPIIFKKNKKYQDNLNLIFLGALVTMMANATFIDVFEASKTAYMFWIMMGVYYKTLSQE